MSVKLLKSIEQLADIGGPAVLAVGVFDGVHLGHRAVIDRAIADAAAMGAVPVIVTFDPHPALILRPQSAPPLLTSTRHKIRLLADAGVNHVLAIPFNGDFAAKSPGSFVTELVDACRPLREICVGEDWAFGKNRGGNLALLSELGRRLSFEAVGIPHVTVAGIAVSSTAIRAAVEEGSLEKAAKLLGREFSVLGTVVEGCKLGRTIGFPTANVRAESEQFPSNGVYAVRAVIDGTYHAGIANIGVRPTVSGASGSRLLEVHVFDFAEQIYGRDIEVFFHRFVRPERKFADIAALRAQIAADVAEVRSGINSGPITGL